MKAYTVRYQLRGFWDTEKSVSFLAKNKGDAYTKAVFEIITEVEKESPYYVYAYSVTYQN